MRSNVFVGLGLTAVVLGTFAVPRRAALAEGTDDAAADAAFQKQLDAVEDRFNDAAGNDRLPHALKICEERLKTKPADFRARIELARLQLAREDFEDAKAEAAKAETAAVGSADVNLSRTVAFLAFFSEAQQKSQKTPAADRKKVDAELRKTLGEMQKALVDGVGDRKHLGELVQGEQARVETWKDFAEIGKPPKAFSGKKDLDGKEISLDAYKGKVLLLDFWATWCGPCVAELPNVVKCYGEFHDKGFEVLGVSLDQDRKKLDDFISTKQIPWRQYFDGKGWQNEVASAWQVHSIPRTYLVDHEGKVRYIGARGEALAPAIKTLLERAAAAAGKN